MEKAGKIPDQESLSVAYSRFESLYSNKRPAFSNNEAIKESHFQISFKNEAIGYPLFSINKQYEPIRELLFQKMRYENVKLQLADVALYL